MITIDKCKESGVFSNSGQIKAGDGYGHTFMGNGSALKTVKFYLSKTGTPTGNISAYLTAHTGTYGSTGLPTGAVLATSNVFDISTLTTTYSLISFTFSGANLYNVLNNNYYCIYITYANGDGSNYVLMGSTGGSSNHPGNSIQYLSSIWYSIPADVVFYCMSEDGNNLMNYSPYLKVENGMSRSERTS